MSRKKIVFLTGTRADFGKIKPLIEAVNATGVFEAFIFATGMHMLPKYGSTVHEIFKCGYENIYLYNNTAFKEGMDVALANTIYGFTGYVAELKPDLIVVHGDRPETLAGAIVGAFNNVRVAHVEGGEISGTIDEQIRHSVSKLVHAHFVTNGHAANRLVRMGESEASIFKIGSPEVDLILSDGLPAFQAVKKYYDITFKAYAIFIYHPVTTEIEGLPQAIARIVTAIVGSKQNYIVVSPNNDSGSDIILNEYKRFDDNSNIKRFLSLRFEYFLTLLKNSLFIIGNSSSGVREAPVCGIPAINIGTRQFGRNQYDSIINVGDNTDEILSAVDTVTDTDFRPTPISRFGDGKSAARFIDALNSDQLWRLPLQKKFNMQRDDTGIQE